MASTPQTDRDEPGSAWPAPLQVEGPAPAAASPTRHPTGPMPIDPGRWGRPAAPTRTVLPRWSPAGPPPPPPAALRSAPEPAESRRQWWPGPASRRTRRRGALVEAGLAAAILVLVALVTTGGPPPSPTQASPGPLAVWSRTGVPAITNLIDDLRVIEVSTAPGTTVPPASLSQVASHLGHDLAAARMLPSPPDGAVAILWTRTLGEMATGDRALGTATVQPDPTTIAVAHLQFALAGADLLEVAQAIQV